MKLNVIAIVLQMLLLLLLAPLVSGCIKTWKARLQNRRGPPVWQPYFDLMKFLRKDMVISEHASWIFRAMPHVLLISTLLAGLLGGFLASALANAWYYFFASEAAVGADIPGLLPDLYTFLLISLLVGAGCGHAGFIAAPTLADLFSAKPRLARVIPFIYSFALAAAIGLITHAVLMFMSYV